MIILSLFLGRLLAETPVSLTEPTPPGQAVEVSSMRSEIVLNGLWRWLPAAGPSEKEPAKAADWGLIWVPGAWGTKMWGHYSNTLTSASIAGVQQAGKGEEWAMWDEELKRGWYEREFNVPIDWKGRSVVVQFDRIATDAEIWVNDVHTGNVKWPSGEIDITQHVTFGSHTKLRLLVSAVQTAKEAIDYMGVGQNTATKASLDLRGVTGDVVVSARPSGARITDVFVKTSTRKQRIDLDCEFTNIAPGTKLTLQAVITNAADGAAVQTFNIESITSAPDSESAVSTSAVIRNVGWEWPNVRLWDTNDPHLYHLELRVSRDGASAPEDAWPVTFGFREFWTEGREFYLNGSRIRLRPELFGDYMGGMPTTAKLAADFARLREHGRNLVEVWPSPKNRGARVQDASVAEAANLAGMLVAIPAVRMNEFTNAPGHKPIWSTASGRDAWLPLFQADWRRLRNHPSIVMMALSGNMGGHDHDQNPRWIGRREMPASTKIEESYKAQAEGDKLAAAFDPTRLRFHHQGGMYGDVFTVNHYLNMIPLQEREEWFSEWARTGDMPYMGVEFGVPFNATYLRGRDGFGNSIGTEPFLAEYASVYFGPEAYAMQGDNYLKAIRDQFVRPDDKTGGLWKTWQGSQALNQSPAFQALTKLFLTRTWRAWRTEGVSGGMIPWDGGYAIQIRNTEKVPQTWQAGRRGWFMPEANAAALSLTFRDEKIYQINPAGLALEENNGPTLAWIAGSAENFHEKRHHLPAGDTLNKQVALLNDTRSKQSFHFTFQVETADGVVVKKVEKSGELEVGETRMLPVAYESKVGDVAGGKKQDLSLVLSAEIGGRSHQDRFTFRVYGNSQERAAPTIMLYDPKGDTKRLLAGLKISHSVFELGKEPSVDSLLVMGRESFQDGKFPLDLGAFVAAGGRALIMGQNPDSIKGHFGMRVAPVPARRLFPVPTAGEWVKDLDAIDLADWTGAGTLVEARPDYAAQSSARPPYGWRWGNNGSVSSAMAEKPHRSGWTPLLEGEWDLAYSPLMELGFGRGRLTFCTLDLEDQAAVDPAAARLTQRLLYQAARPVEAARTESLTYIGSPAGEKLLRHIGVNFQPETQLPANAKLIVVDAETSLTDAQLDSFAQQAGTVVMLAQPGGATPGRLGVTLREAKDFTGGTAPETDVLTRGLSASDLRWRTPHDLQVLEKGATIMSNGLLGTRAVGSGRIIFIQVDPLGFDLKSKPYFKHTQWRLTRALSQVLANLGASFAADRLIFYPQVKRIELAGPWAVKFTAELPLATWEKPYPDAGISENGKAMLADGVDVAAWDKFDLPANHPRFSEVSGEAVWRREVNIPAAWKGKSAVLHIPAIKSFDTVTFNGVEIGSTSKDTDPKNPNPWNTPRIYQVAPELVREGANVIAIRQFVPDKDGGVHGRADEFYLQVTLPEDETLRAYIDNWNSDFKYGDDPYRYYRW